MILRPCVVLLHLLSQHDRILSRKEMPCMKIQSCIREFHVYKDVWTPVTEEILVCSRECIYLHDPVICQKESVWSAAFFWKEDQYHRQRNMGIR